MKHDEEERCQAFKVFDEDDTGFLEASELRITLTDLGNNMLPGDIDKALHMSDMDGDGTILYDEVLKITKKNEEAFEYQLPEEEKKEEGESGLHNILMTHTRPQSPGSTPSS